MAKTKTIAGTRYGRLTAVRPLIFDKLWKWVFQCDCGARVILVPAQVKRGNTSSCGCLHRDQLRAKFTRHGGSSWPEHNAWMSMKTRCENPKALGFKGYGGRGIKVCERWQTFENFIADMGRRPFPGASVERKNNDGNYEPDNCRWATRTEQGYNKRSTRTVEIDGETLCITDAARRRGLPPKTVQTRVNALGWDVQRALSEPVRPWPARKPSAAAAGAG